MRSRFEDIYDQAWRQHGAPGAEPSVPSAKGEQAPAFDRRLPLATFRQMDTLIRDRLGARAKGIIPLLDRARVQLSTLFPEDRPSEVHGPDRGKGLKDLRITFDKIEDLLQALQLTPRAR